MADDPANQAGKILVGKADTNISCWRSATAMGS